MKTLDISNFKVLQTKAETEVLWQDLTTPVRKPTNPWCNCKHHTAGHAQQQMRKMERLTKSMAYKVLRLSKCDSHVTAMWTHLRNTKGQDYVDLIVALRKAKRQPYFTLQK